MSRLLNVFQHPWSALSSGAVFFVSHKDTKAQRGRTCRKAAFSSDDTTGRTVERKKDLTVPTIFFVPLCLCVKQIDTALTNERRAMNAAPSSA
jgi:hypothetical protein